MPVQWDMFFFTEIRFLYTAILHHLRVVVIEDLADFSVQGGGKSGVIESFFIIHLSINAYMNDT